jgi:hypothetical protein
MDHMATSIIDQEMIHAWEVKRDARLRELKA